MVLENQRLDITDRIIGRLGTGEIELFEESEKIGRILLNRVGGTFELRDGYQEEQNKIYKTVTVTDAPGQKYVDCDSESGWC